MKKLIVFVMLLAVLTVFSGCFASPDDDLEAVSAVIVTTTAGSTTATSATTTVTTTTTAPAAISKYPCTAYATDSLNVRRTPNTDYHAIGGLHEGEQVTVIGREGDFYQINFSWSDTDENGQTQSGSTAYVSAQYISINRATATTTTGLSGGTPTVATTTVATATAAQ